MLSSCRLHEAGILHCDLTDGHHFVPMGTGVRIVDFSTAMRHRCLKGSPFVTLGPRDAPLGCPELLHMEALYGIYSGEATHMTVGRQRIPY
jgi:hypothetical protein